VISYRRPLQRNGRSSLAAGKQSPNNANREARLQTRGQRQNSSHVNALVRTQVILRGEVLEVRNVDGALHITRKAKKPDGWNSPFPEYDPLTCDR
jgi:hypothetical protein